MIMLQGSRVLSVAVIAAVMAGSCYSRELGDQIDLLQAYRDLAFYCDKGVVDDWVQHTNFERCVVRDGRFKDMTRTVTQSKNFSVEWRNADIDYVYHGHYEAGQSVTEYYDERPEKPPFRRTRPAFVLREFFGTENERELADKLAAFATNAELSNDKWIVLDHFTPDPSISLVEGRPAGTNERMWINRTDGLIRKYEQRGPRQFWRVVQVDDVNTSAEPSPDQLWYEAPLAARMKSHPYRVMLGVCAIAFLLGCLTALGARPKSDSDIIKPRPVPVWKLYWILVAISFAGVLALLGLAAASGGLALIIPLAAGYYALILLLPVGCLLLGKSVWKAVRGRNPPRTAGISRPIF